MADIYTKLSMFSRGKHSRMNNVNTSTFPVVLVVVCILIIISVSCGIGTTRIDDMISVEFNS